MVEENGNQPIRLRKREILLNKVFLGPENVD